MEVKPDDSLPSAARCRLRRPRLASTKTIAHLPQTASRRPRFVSTKTAARSSATAYCMLLAAALMLSGCAGIKEFDVLSLFQQTQIKLAYSKADSLLKKNEPVEAAQSLWTDADKFPPPFRQELQTRAGEILLDHGHTLAANRYLRQIDETSLDGAALLKKRTLQAQFYDETGQYERVLALLPDNILESGDENMQISALWLVAEALHQTDQLIPAIEARIRLHQIISDEEQPYNADKLWQLALTADASKARAELDNEHSAPVKNWLELADLANPLEIDIPTLQQHLQRWKARNQRWNLSETVDEELLQRWQYLDFSPKNVSVMLPLTGTYAKYGRAVRNGLLYAHNQTTANLTLQFRNTDTEEDIADVYLQVAADNNAELIIGPLLKEKANQLITEETLPVPVITLNYSLENMATGRNEVFRFGLLPEDETLQVAQEVRDEGHDFITVLAPDNSWGERLLASFSERFSSLGGSIRRIERYDTTLVDYSTMIENMLLLNESRQRHARLSKAIGYRPDFTPRIRDDITAIVLLADSQRAALIYPQLKYHYADKLPTYATSHAYKVGEIKNRDLDGLNYLDAPIMLYPEKLDVPDKYLQDYPRLFALGVDTYHLITLFRQMSLSHRTYDGMTGKLSITPDRRLFRKLQWAKFRNGKPVLSALIY